LDLLFRKLFCETNNPIAHLQISNLSKVLCDMLIIMIPKE